MEKHNRVIKHSEEDSAHPWLELLLQIFQRVCIGVTIGGALGSIVAIVQGRKNGAEVAAVVVLYALIMVILAEWIMRYMKRSLP